MSEQELDDMTEGYRAGYFARETEFPERLKNRGAQFQHGWLNGRDDRLGRPRGNAKTLREAAVLATLKDAMP